MDFCVGTCAKIDQVGLIKQAEDLGVTHSGVGEGPLLFSDPYQQMALASQQTSTIKMGTYVTNPLTRIAPVTANSVATLNALAPGRTFVGIGTANNALRSMGNKPATIRELTDAVNVTRGLLRGERVTHRWRGEETEIEFLDRDRYLVRHCRRADLDGRGRPERTQGRRSTGGCGHLLPRPEPGHDQTGPPRT